MSNLSTIDLLNFIVENSKRSDQKQYLTQPRFCMKKRNKKLRVVFNRASPGSVCDEHKRKHQRCPPNCPQRKRAIQALDYNQQEKTPDQVTPFSNCSLDLSTESEDFCALLLMQLAHSK